MRGFSTKKMIKKCKILTSISLVSLLPREGGILHFFTERGAWSQAQPETQVLESPHGESNLVAWCCGKMPGSLPSGHGRWHQELGQITASATWGQPPGAGSMPARKGLGTTPQGMVLQDKVLRPELLTRLRWGCSNALTTHHEGRMVVQKQSIWVGEVSATCMHTQSLNCVRLFEIPWTASLHLNS